MKHYLTTVSIFCCMILSVSNGYAQKGKMVKQIISTVAEQSPKTLSKSISSSSSLAAESLAASNIKDIVSKNTPAFSLSDELTKAERNYLQDVGIAMDFTKNKKVLNFSFALEQERANARRLVATLQKYQTLNLDNAQENALLDKMSGFLVNNSLQDYLLDALANKNYMQFMRELANYYSLSVKFMTSYELRFIVAQDTREIFAQTALDYMKAHPHKMNLKLREIMKSPFVTPELKSSLRSFIALNKILPQQENAFLTLLREAHKQHSTGLTSARSQADITNTIEVYRNTAKELESFIKRYNRSPRWNAPLPERRLYNKLLLLITHNQMNRFKQVAPYISNINQLLSQYPPIRFTAEETLQKLKKFVKQNNRLPQSVSENPEKAGTTEAEIELYDNMFHWVSNDKAFAQEFHLLQNSLLDNAQ